MAANASVASGLVVGCEDSQQSSSGPSPSSQRVKSDVWRYFEKSGHRAKSALCKCATSSMRTMVERAICESI